NAVRKVLNWGRVASAWAGPAGKLYVDANVATRKIPKRIPEMLATFDSRPPGLSDDEPIAAKFLPPRGMLGRLLKRIGDRRGAHGDQQWRFHANSVSCRCDQFRSSPWLAPVPSGPRARPMADEVA